MTPADKAKNRYMMRQLLDGGQLIVDVLGIANSLERERSGLGQTEVTALKASADLKMRLLNKVLPDLKSVEHDISEGLMAMKDEDLNARIRELIVAYAASSGDEGGIAAALEREGPSLQ